MAKTIELPVTQFDAALRRLGQKKWMKFKQEPLGYANRYRLAMTPDDDFLFDTSEALWEYLGFDRIREVGMNAYCLFKS